MNLEELREEVQAILGREYEVRHTSVTKMNDEKLEGLSIGKVGDKVYPTIYVNDEMTAQDVVDIYHKRIDSGNDLCEDIDNNEVFTKEYVLENVFPILMSRDRNKELLKTTVHRPYANLDIAYRVKLKNVGDSDATFLVRSNHLDLLGITEDDLYKNAVRNIKGMGRVNNMAYMLKKMGMPVELADEQAESCPMKVITTINCVNGAGAILDTEVIEELKNTVGDCYIIPSSIHELIAVPMDGVEDVEDLVKLIKEVNETVLQKNEYLSDNAYVITDGRLEVAA